MPDYRRAYVPGGTVFLTLVSHERRPIFSDANRVSLLRAALRRVRAERPFEVVAAVVLPDHVHFLWSLPPGDADYSRRVGRLKVEFTRSLGASRESASDSRKKHRESTVWQRRFWEHTIIDERDLEAHADYIDENPVKHGHASCPHAWPSSSFRRWVAHGHYDPLWVCSCDGHSALVPRLADIGELRGSHRTATRFDPCRVGTAHQLLRKMVGGAHPTGPCRAASATTRQPGVGSA